MDRDVSEFAALQYELPKRLGVHAEYPVGVGESIRLLYVIDGKRTQFKVHLTLLPTAVSYPTGLLRVLLDVAMTWTGSRSTQAIRARARRAEGAAGRLAQKRSGEVPVEAALP